LHFACAPSTMASEDPASTPPEDPALETSIAVKELTEPPPTAAAAAVTSAALAAAMAMDEAEEASMPAPPPAALPAVPPPAAPEAPPPTTPSKAPAPETVVVVHVAPTPDAEKFLETMTDVTAKVATLGHTEVRDGMYELSHRCKDSMKSSFGTFQAHTLDLAITASSDISPGVSRFGLLKQQAEVKKLAMLPVAAFYAVMAALCFLVFAVIYYPKLYGPKLYVAAKEKFIEYKLDQHASVAFGQVTSKSVEAYSAAKNSEMAAKGFDYVNKGIGKAGEAYNSVAASAIGAKSAELAAKGRTKLAEKLVALRDGSASRPVPEPMEPHTPV